MGNYLEKMLNYNIIDVNNCISINDHNNITKKFYNNPSIWDIKDKELIKKIYSKIQVNFNKNFTNNVNLSIDKIIYYEIVNPIVNNDLESKKYALSESIKGFKKNFDFNYLPELRCFYLLPLINHDKYLYFCIRRINYYLYKSINKYDIYYLFLQKILMKYINIDIKNSDNFEFTDWSIINPILINKFNNIKFNKDNDLITKIKKNLSKLNDYKIHLFVDSSINSLCMLYILSNLYPNKINVIHISTQNKILETKLITNYCILLDLKLKTIKLHELVNFDKKMIKFNKYYKKRFIEKIINQMQHKYSEWDIVQDDCIIFCNNYDDNFKYLINSIVNKKEKNSINEIKPYFKNKNIHVFRPLVNIKDKELIKYAINHGIPHKLKYTNNNNNILKNTLSVKSNSFIDGIYHLYKQ